MRKLDNKIIDSIVGLRIRQKRWLKKHKELTGKSASRLIRELLDKEIKRQNRAAKRKGNQKSE